MIKLESEIKRFEISMQRMRTVLAELYSEIVLDSAIKRFELTFDLAWKSLKTFLEEQKGVICASPKECFREAYRQKVIGYSDEWLAVVDMRNEAVHTYNEKIAEKIYTELPEAVGRFEELFEALTKVQK